MNHLRKIGRGVEMLLDGKLIVPMYALVVVLLGLLVVAGGYAGLRIPQEEEKIYVPAPVCPLAMWTGIAILFATLLMAIHACYVAGARNLLAEAREEAREAEDIWYQQWLLARQGAEA